MEEDLRREEAKQPPSPPQPHSPEALGKGDNPGPRMPLPGQPNAPHPPIPHQP